VREGWGSLGGRCAPGGVQRAGGPTVSGKNKRELQKKGREGGGGRGRGRGEEERETQRNEAPFESFLRGGGVGNSGNNNRYKMSRNQSSSLPSDSTGRLLCCVTNTPGSALPDECFSAPLFYFPRLYRLLFPDMVKVRPFPFAPLRILCCVMRTPGSALPDEWCSAPLIFFPRLDRFLFSAMVNSSTKWGAATHLPARTHGPHHRTAEEGTRKRRRRTGSKRSGSRRTGRNGSRRTGTNGRGSLRSATRVGSSALACFGSLLPPQGPGLPPPPQDPGCLRSARSPPRSCAGQRRPRPCAGQRTPKAGRG